MIRRMGLMLIAVLLVVGVIAWLKYSKMQAMMGQMAAMGAALPTVSAAKATREDWQPKIDVVGSLRAVRGVDIAGELAGIVSEIDFSSGGDVNAGDMLIKLRADDDIAKLQALQATQKLAGITLARDAKQLKAQAVAQATVDSDTANLANLKAQAAEQKAIVDKKLIHAPFSGHLGIRNVDLGQYLNAGTAIVTLQQLDPIYIDFFVPQQALSRIKLHQAVTVRNDAYPDREFAGEITAVNPKVESSTRNIQVRAALKNADHALLPGMYATASIASGAPQPYVTLPQTAITYNPYGNTVFILKSKDKDAKAFTATQTFVTLGDTRGDQVSVLKGVSEGDLVVTSGQMKLQNNASVLVDNSIAPKSDANPKPADE